MQTIESILYFDSFLPRNISELRDAFHYTEVSRFPVFRNSFASRFPFTQRARREVLLPRGTNARRVTVRGAEAANWETRVVRLVKNKKKKRKKKHYPSVNFLRESFLQGTRHGLREFSVARPRCEYGARIMLTRECRSVSFLITLPYRCVF